MTHYMKKCTFCGSNPEKVTLGYECSGDNKANPNVMDCPLNGIRFDGDCDSDQWNMRHEDKRIKEAIEFIDNWVDRLDIKTDVLAGYLEESLLELKQILKGDDQLELIDDR